MGRCSGGLNFRLHAIERGLRGVPEFDEYMGGTRDYITSARLERDIPKVPHAVGAPDLCEPLYEVVAVLDQGTTSIFAEVHWRGAGMVSLSGTRHLEAADAHDARHDADLFAFG